MKTSWRKTVTRWKKKTLRTNALDIKEYFTSGQFNLYELHLSVVFFHLFVLTVTLSCSLVQSLHCIAAAPPALLIANNSNTERVSQTPVSNGSRLRHSLYPMPLLFHCHSLGCSVWLSRCWWEGSHWLLQSLGLSCSVPLWEEP